MPLTFLIMEGCVLQSIISVGIDIGTSTTQVVFSRLSMENTAGYFSVPQISIVDKKVVYKSDVYTTPLKSSSLIDGEAVRGIVENVYNDAGFRPADIGTGAVIITGESAKKENSEIVLKQLSSFAGEFVVSTAGSDLEAIIAGKGSGAAAFSNDGETVANIDIGGGTANIAIFDCGDAVSKGCVDIGGRLVTVSPDMTVTYISESARLIAESCRADIVPGKKTSMKDLSLLCEGMAALLERSLGIGGRTELLDKIKTNGSSDLVINKPVSAVCFSGGVANFIYDDERDKLKFGDIGVLLGDAVRNSRLVSDFKLIKASETISATVIGAGTYTTSISGSTIDYARDILPLKNIPVLRLSESEQKSCFDGDSSVLEERARWFLSQCGGGAVVLALRGEPDPSFLSIKRLGEAISSAMDSVLPAGEPIIVVLECDIAKALGMQIKQFSGGARSVISLDSIKVSQDDFIDIGKPLMDGIVVPVVVKTLIFG